MAQNTNRTANNQNAPTAQSPIAFRAIPDKTAVEFAWPNGKRGAFGFNEKGDMRLTIWAGEKKIITFDYPA